MINNFLKNWLSLEIISKITNSFLSEGLDIRFVGGCVRDSLLNIESLDFDLCVNCSPYLIEEILLKNKLLFNNKWKKYGSINILDENLFIQITSLREDYNHSGRKADVRFTTNFKKDACRRDFSFNAIYLTPNGEISDFFEGIKDIKENKVRFIGDAQQRIEEDYLRIVRYYRFLAMFKTPNIIFEYHDIILQNLKKLSLNIFNDKILIELDKMAKNPYSINSFMDINNSLKKNVLIEYLIQIWTQQNFVRGLDKIKLQLNNF